MSTNSIPDTLWHYCSPETFKLILSNKTIRLIQEYMNDARFAANFTVAMR